MRFILIVLLLYPFIISCEPTHERGDGIIRIDTKATYPDLDLKVTDIADFRYIKLGGEEEGLHIDIVGTGGVFIDKEREHIIVAQSMINIVIAVFDMQGHLIRKIGRQGHGPGEYRQGFRIAFDSKSDIITIYNEEKFIQYKSSGEFLGETPTSFDTVWGSLFLQEDDLVFFNPTSQGFQTGDENTVIKNNGRVLTVRRNDNLEIVPCHDHIYGKKWDMNSQSWIMGFGSVCPTNEGHLLSSNLSDTTYLFDKSHNMIPYLIDTRHNLERDYVLCPTIDTRDYLFVALLPSLNELYPAGQQFFAIRKRDKKVFSCGDGPGFRLALQEKTKFLLSSQTKTPGYGMSLIRDADLKEAANNGAPIPIEVQELSKNMNEESNPILMLLTFK